MLKALNSASDERRNKKFLENHADNIFGVINGEKFRIESTINEDINKWMEVYLRMKYILFQLICLAYKTKIEESTLPFSIGRYFLFSFLPLSRLYMCCAYFILFPLLFNSKWNSNGYFKCFLMFDIFISSYYVSIHILLDGV